jgi:hypothetical protein
MHWKNLTYQIKGGFIAVFGGLVGILIATILSFYDIRLGFGFLWFLGFPVPILAGYLLAPIYSDCVFTIKPDSYTCTMVQQIPGYIFGLIITLGVYFLFGMFLGWIINRIKSK